jgi:hypothetical protein
MVGLPRVHRYQKELMPRQLVIPSDLPLSPHPPAIDRDGGLQARSAAMLFDPGGISPPLVCAAASVTRVDG